MVWVVAGDVAASLLVWCSVLIELIGNNLELRYLAWSVALGDFKIKRQT